MPPFVPPAEHPDVASTSPRRRLSRRASVVGLVIVVLVGAGLSWLVWSATQGNGTPPAPGARGVSGGAGGRGAPATTVGIATAERIDLPVTLEALGTVTPTATSTVRPQVSGVLKEVMFREGQMVKAGQLLALIDARPFELQLQQASGQRLRDEAQLENARLTLDRYRQLLALDSIARQDVDTQAALVKQLEAAVITSRGVEGSARLNLAYTRITAPISGRVGLRVVDAGNLVNGNDAEGIAVITQLAPIDVEFAIPQDHVPDVQSRAVAGAQLPVVVLDRTRRATLDTGAFLSLDNQVDVQTGTVRAKARFANAKATLFPSQFVNVRLALRTIADAVVVPVTALRHGSAGDYLYVLNAAERTVALRPVVRGEATIDRMQITQGLDVGEIVITEGADRLKDGARVTLPHDAPRAPAGDGAPPTGRNAGSPTAEGRQAGPRPPGARETPARPGPRPAP